MGKYFIASALITMFSMGYTFCKRNHEEQIINDLGINVDTGTFLWACEP